ncbi:ribosomal RNA processing protein 36 homolog [Brachyhypopomus gauderio]|uniref:ribosomal RNA processing protein 36 homolog n=1 Tax=Brachyhypopomus gauderio TaxID=698409 RepID=UPI004041A310
MTSKKKQTALEQKPSHTAPAHEQIFKKSKSKTRHITKRASIVEENDSDEEEVLEMERNFVLLSKRNSVQVPQEERNRGIAEEEDEDDDDDGEDEDDDGEDEDDDGEDEDDDGEDEDNEDDDDTESVSRTRRGHSSSEKDNLKKDLSAMSFEEVMQLQNKMGIKAYKKIAYGTKTNRPTGEPVKQLSKHRPQEISAKKPVHFLRKVVPVKKTLSRDPRFDDLSGEFRPELFSQTYEFINEIRQKETEMVKKKLKKVKSNAKRDEMKYLLQRLENQERGRQRQEQQRQKEILFKRTQRQLVEQGHRPFYLKKSDQKKLELAEKYNQLKKSGKLENFLSKKRKRNAIKDRRRMPYQKN